MQYRSETGARAQITPFSDLYCIDAIHNFEQYSPSFFIEKAIEQI